MLFRSPFTPLIPPSGAMQLCSAADGWVPPTPTPAPTPQAASGSAAKKKGGGASGATPGPPKAAAAAAAPKAEEEGDEETDPEKKAKKVRGVGLQVRGVGQLRGPSRRGRPGRIGPGSEV